jgi:ABC transporter substrate binding protein
MKPGGLNLSAELQRSIVEKFSSFRVMKYLLGFAVSLGDSVLVSSRRSGRVFCRCRVLRIASRGTRSVVFRRSEIAEFAAKYRIPTISGWEDFAVDGNLMTYGPNLQDAGRHVATYVDKVLKGAKPADLPVEQPRKPQLVINLKTAKALGLTIPPSLLLRADRVVE